MKSFFKIKLLLFATTLAFGLHAQQDHKHLLNGDDLYKQEKFSEAELSYRRALEEKQSSQGSYNLGNSTYRQGRYEEAIKQYESAASTAAGTEERANAYHNLGNAHFQAGQFEESVEAYKNALRLNPNDIDTKQNLSMALRQLPPPQEQPQQQDGDQNQNEQQNQEQQQDQQQDQQQQQNQQQQDSQSEQDQESQGEPQSQPEDLSKEEAAKLLEIMDQEEQKVQEKLRKAGSKTKPTKDW